MTLSSLRERKKVATKERIYREAITLFRQKGFAATTIEEIAAAAEISKGTFFNYFPSKEALLLFLSEHQVQTVTEEIAAAVQDPTLDTHQKLSRIFRRLAANLETDRALTRATTFEMLKHEELLANDPYRKLFGQAVYQLIYEGQVRGEVQQVASAELITRTLTGLYFQIFFEWCLRAEKTFVLAERLDQTLDLVWQGLQP